MIVMSRVISPVYRINRYGGAACEHCLGIVHHASWCLTRNTVIFYAYDILVHPEKVTEQDKIYLHALGVLWFN